jgi:hypothetical protein
MNADDRATTTSHGNPASAGTAAPSTPQRSAFRPITPSPTAQPSAPQQPTRASAFTPAAGTPTATPRATAPTATPRTAPSTAPTPAVGTERPSAFQWPGSGEPTPTAPTRTVPTRPAAPAAPESGSDAGAPGAFSAGVDKVKGFALRAKTSLTEGDDMAASKNRGGPRKARVLVSRVDPWSVLKIGFLLSIAAGIVLVVAVFVIWNVLNQTGLFVLVNDWVEKLFDGQQKINLEEIFKLNKVMSAATLISVVNVVLLTALSTVAAFLYNTVSSVVGGIYVTLTDD